jgi:hypothetical protein
MIKLTLGHDSAARKRVQLLAAFLRYVPAAAARFALHSQAGNDKHNPGEPVHHARGKSSDHEECILRHLVDMQDIRAYMERNGEGPEAVRMLLDEATAEFWRAGVFLQELCEKYEGAPLAPGARLPARAEINPQGDPDMRQPLPQIVNGAPFGCQWAIVSSTGILGAYDDAATAQAALDVMLGLKPINTPAEAAELAKAQGTVRVVGMVPELAAPYTDTVPSGTDDIARGVDFDFPYPEGTGRDQGIDDAPFVLIDDEPLERCGHMSDTKRVCVLPAGHLQWHSDGVMNWFPPEG